jgi:hypothetical protein
MMKVEQRKRGIADTGPVTIQRRLAVMRPEPEGGYAIRVSHRVGRKRGTGRILPRYLLRCGCCDQTIEIYYGDEELEIGGVNGSLENWREILLPLLQVTRPRKINAGLAKADADIKAGRVSKAFSDHSEFIAALHQEAANFSAGKTKRPAN